MANTYKVARVGRCKHVLSASHTWIHLLFMLVKAQYYHSLYRSRTWDLQKLRNLAKAICLVSSETWVQTQAARPQSLWRSILNGQEFSGMAPPPQAQPWASTLCATLPFPPGSPGSTDAVTVQEKPLHTYYYPMQSRKRLERPSNQTFQNRKIGVISPVAEQ